MWCEAARVHGVESVMILGSSCIYPRLAPQPMPEESLLTGPLEPTNQWYAIAKIAGVKLAQAYRRQYGMRVISAMPTNLYGPNDNYHPENGHVIATLLRRFHEAKLNGANEVTIWGTGSPRREFLHADDLADALVFVLREWDDERPINIGSGEEVSIAELAEVIAGVVGWKGELVFDRSKPDGAPRKLVDTRRLSALGWKPSIDLRAGLGSVYREFCQRWEKGLLAAGV